MEKRFIAAFVIVALIVSASGIFGVFWFAKTERDYEHALENYGFASGKIGMLSSEINRNRAYVRDIAFLTDREKMDIAHRKIQEGSATSEQSAAASETLNGQANRMRQRIARFKLKQTRTKVTYNNTPSDKGMTQRYI